MQIHYKKYIIAFYILSLTLYTILISLNNSLDYIKQRTNTKTIKQVSQNLSQLVAKKNIAYSNGLYGSLSNTFAFESSLPALGNPDKDTPKPYYLVLKGNINDNQNVIFTDNTYSLLANYDMLNNYYDNKQIHLYLVE